MTASASMSLDGHVALPDDTDGPLLGVAAGTIAAQVPDAGLLDRAAVDLVPVVPVR